MPENFHYGVFLSHSAKDKAGDNILAKIEEGLEHSIWISAVSIHPSAFFLKPPSKGSLAHSLYINWLPADRENNRGTWLGIAEPSTTISLN